MSCQQQWGGMGERAQKKNGPESLLSHFLETDGAAGRNRTHDPLVRSQVLYPAELQPPEAGIIAEQGGIEKPAMPARPGGMARHRKASGKEKWPRIASEPSS